MSVLYALTKAEQLVSIYKDAKQNGFDGWFLFALGIKEIPEELEERVNAYMYLSRSEGGGVLSRGDACGNARVRPANPGTGSPCERAASHTSATSNSGVKPLPK